MNLCTQNAPCVGKAFPPRALQHQDAVVQAISSVFSLPQNQFKALSQGGGRALEKLIRSYQYWASECGATGANPYDDLHLGYFRMTPLACMSGDIKLLHREHVVPIARLAIELVHERTTGMGAVSVAAAQQIMQLNEIVLVHKSEERLLNKSYRCKMHPTWDPSQSHLDRLTRVLGLSSSSLCGQRLIGP